MGVSFNGGTSTTMAWWYPTTMGFLCIDSIGDVEGS